MSDDRHVTQVLEAMPSEKAARKKSRTLVGAMLAAFGTIAALGAFVPLVLLITNGATLDKWSVGIVALLFVGGFVMVGTGAHIMSGELVGAFWKDLGGIVRSVWRRNGNGGAS